MRPFRQGLRAVSFVLLVVAVSGCGGQGPSRAAVSGQVTLDGEPVGAGSISFVPTGETTGPVAGATITSGRYSIPALKGPVIGQYRVSIRATRKTGKKVRGEDGSMVDEVVNAAPAKYNIASTLQHNIKPGKNVADFELTSD